MVTPHPPTTVRWRILALLFVASFVAYVLRTNMSVVGEAMMPALGLSKVQLGIILAAFAWGYAIFQFPGGVIGDRVGGRATLTAMLLGWGVFTLLSGAIPAAGAVGTTALIAILAVIRFGMGVVQAPLYPVTSGGLTWAWFPPGGWAFPNSLTNAGLTLGSAATGPLIAWLMTTFGWRMAFILTAPSALILAGLWWWYARDLPAQHRSVNEGELQLINAGRVPQAALAPGAWRAVLGNRDILLLTASYFCSNFVFYFFFNWLFVYLVDNRGFKVLESGMYSAAPWLTGAVGALIGGLLSDRLCKSRGMTFGCRVPVMTGLILSGLLLLAGANAHNPVVAVVFLSLCLGFQQMAEGPFWAATISVSGKHSSSACGVLNTGGNVVGGIGALMVPFTVKLFGWPAALATGTGFAMIGALLWFWIRADREFPAAA